MRTPRLKMSKAYEKAIHRGRNGIRNMHILKGSILLGFKNIPMKTTISYNFHL